MSTLPKRSPLVRPDYVVQAAKRKYKSSSKSIYGAFEFDVNWFWSVGTLVALRIDPPTEVGRYFVDVEVKEVYNDGSQPKEVEINTLHAQSQEKTYRLSQSQYAIFGSGGSRGGPGGARPPLKSCPPFYYLHLTRHTVTSGSLLDRHNARVSRSKRLKSASDRRSCL